MFLATVDRSFARAAGSSAESASCSATSTSNTSVWIIESTAPERLSSSSGALCAINFAASVLALMAESLRSRFWP